MAITLAQAKVTMVDKVDQMVTDEFRRSSQLLDMMTFDDAVAPATGGSTLTYSYTRLKTPSTASGRALNTEYTANQAVREKASTDLKIFGGAFELDRVLQDTSGSLNEITFQLQQKIIGARNLFHNMVINGDDAVDDKSFDGLSKMLTGTKTELGTDAVTDLTEVDADKGFKFLELLDNFLSSMDGRPSAIMGNTKMINKIKAVARRTGYYSRTENAFGKGVDNYDNIPLLDLGYFYNGTSTQTVVPTVDRTIATVEQKGLTDLYAVNFALDGFHGVTPQGGVGIKTYMPDMSQPGAVKKGEVEMVTGVALKNSLKAAVLRNIKL
ncbi:hypothetical protein QK908_03975 [Lactococcus cremoris]